MSGKPEVKNVKWMELEKLEGQHFPTDREYHIVVQREAIPIVFVPGIMGSRLYNSSTKELVWDPDDADFMKSTYLRRFGTGMASPEERLRLLVGPSFKSDYLEVCGNFPTDQRLVFPGHFSDSTRKRIVQDTQVYWDWARRDQRVSEQARYDKSANLDGTGGYSRSTLPRLPWEPEVQPETNDNMGGNLGTLTHEAQVAVTNGWAGVLWSFYGKLLQSLSEERWEKFNKCFYFPIYCFGYNWTDSNEVSGQKLADFINKLIPHEQTREGASNLCNYCIVVTHSMGGLVARWASEKCGAKQKILGVVHGAQPVTGTPSGYHEFRAGENAESFWGPALKGETPTAWGTTRVIGYDASHIDPIFGHCPGPLQLLPSNDYVTTRDNANPKHRSSKNWLFQTDSNNREIQALPSGDAYSKIYNNMGIFLGFGDQSANVLNDSAAPIGGAVVKGSPLSRPRSGQAVLINNVTQASNYHRDMHPPLCHPNTFYGYGVALAAKTYDEINYSFKRSQMEDQYTPDGMMVSDPGDSDLGHGVDLDAARKAYYKIDGKKASGDGTVSASSSTSLGKPGAYSHDSKPNYPEAPDETNDSVIRALPVNNVEHSQFYQRDEAIDFVKVCVRDLAQNYMCKVTGKPNSQKMLRVPPF